MATPSRSRPANRLLAKLPAAESARLAPLLELMPLPFKHPIYRAGATIEQVYFPTSGVASSVAYVADGTAIEVTTVGDEGMLGLPALFGAAGSPNEVFMQVEGEGFQMSAGALHKTAGAGTHFHQVLVKYLSAYMFQVSQAVACNGVHTIKQRCCRWLLMTQDRVHSDELPLTHEFLAVMLGVRRASVSEVLHPLQESGLVRSERGVITILDRARLEAGSCECYRLVVEEYARLLG